MSSVTPCPLDGDAPRPLFPAVIYWFGIEGTEGTGSTVGSKSDGKLAKRVEYRRFTRSEVCEMDP
jgi:hypothetical protein